jgi:hypothetical protein
MDSSEGDDTFVTYSYRYLFVFWKQDEASSSEIALLRGIDPYLRDKPIHEVTSLMKDAIVWQIGPLYSATEADALEAKLGSAGFTVQLKWQ